MSQPRNLQTRPLPSISAPLEETAQPSYSAGMGIPSKIALVVKGMSVKIVLQITEPIELGRSYSDNETTTFIDLHPFGAEEQGVSRRHLRIWSENGELFIADLASTNGTRFNGAPLAPHIPQRIHHADRIRIGGLELEVEFIVDILG